MGLLQMSLFILNVIGVMALVAAVSFTSVMATCGEGPAMRRRRARR